MHALGKAAPFLILTLVIVATFYVSQEQSREQVESANKQLVDTYKAIGQLGTDQLKNLRESLSLHTEITKSVSAERSALQTIKNELKEAKLQRDLEDEQRSRAVGEYNDLASKLKKADGDNIKLTLALANSTRSVAQSSERTKELLATLRTLATAINSDNVDSDARTLAKSALALDIATARQILINWRTTPKRERARGIGTTGRGSP